MEDRIGVTRGGPVGSLKQNLGGYLLGDLGRDNSPDRGRDQYVAVEPEQLLIGDDVPSAETLQHPVLFHIFHGLDDVYPGSVVDATGVIGDSDHLAAGF